MNVKKLLVIQIFIIISIGILWLCGCNASRKGDFTAFFIAQMKEYGGRCVKTNDLPVIQARWSVKKDSYGFECLVFDIKYEEVESMVIQVFGVEGERYKPPEASRPSRMFKASDVGVALLISETPDGVRLNCLMGVKDTLTLFTNLHKIK